MLARLRATAARRRNASRALAFRPRYDDGGLLDACASGNASMLREILADGGDTNQVLRLAVEHFDRVLAERFFCDARALLLEPRAGDERLAHWMKSASKQTLDAMQAGLPVYSRRTSPLRPGYPWGSVQGEDSDDILFAVQPHRFAFAPRMALAVCDRTVAPEDLRDVLLDWMRFAQMHPRLPFFSNLIAVQRLLASTWAFQYLAAADDAKAGAECRAALLEIIAQDIRYLSPRLGTSYPNNHLLVDRFADWFIAVCFPEFARPGCDLDDIEACWLRELRNQTYDDGGGAEHCVHYHGLACEMASAYLLLARVNGRPVSADDVAHVGRMLRLQADLGGPDGNAPAIGDSSDDPLFALDRGSGDASAAFRELYRGLIDARVQPARRDLPGIERAFWLLGGRLAARAETVEERHFAEYPDSGLTILADEAEATRCTFRTGPAPHARVLCGHMHSDLMSITITCGGTPLLVDAGSFTYRFRQPRGGATPIVWREYFTGPRSHNGLVVAGKDPLVPLVRDFRIAASMPAVVRVAGGADRELAFVEAEMQEGTAYPGFVRGVVHIHGLGYIVYNQVRNAGKDEETQLAFQLAPACAVHRVDDTRLAVRRDTVDLSIVACGLPPAEIVTGSDDPPNGWVSSRYGDRVAAPQLIYPLAHDAGLTAFVMAWQGGWRSASLSCRQPSETSRSFCIRSDEFTDFVLLNAGSPDAVVSDWGITLRGRLAWLRAPADGRPALRCLEATSCEAPAYDLQYRLDAPAAELSR
jgi:hypothetical protein